MARNRKRMQTKIRECSSFCTTKKRMASKPYLNKKPRIIATSSPPALGPPPPEFRAREIEGPTQTP